MLPASGDLLLVAVAAALITGLTALAVLTAADRKRIAWTVETDLPVWLAHDQSPPTVFFGNHAPRGAGQEPGWVVVIAIRNAGLGPVRGTDFRDPLTFAFPGREICATQVHVEPAEAQPGRSPVRPPTVVTDSTPDTGWPGVEINDDLLLRRRETFTLILLLRGTALAAAPRISQRGALTGGKIIPKAPDSHSASGYAAIGTRMLAR